MGRKRKSPSQVSNSKHEPKKRRIIEEEVEEPDKSTETDEHGRAGRVLRVYLKNFMCHTSLEINLNPNVNYIIGRNGSGKSAILTALIVGLGGKANMTNRGSSMKAFIKTGQTSANIEITISNDGPMAFKPKQYGKQITVVRSFSETGGSRYKLRGEKGEVVSSLFRDVRRLAEALNIQVDNPVCILNQDIARTFLNTNDTTKKYQMFMKATNMENIQEQYNIGLQNKQTTITTLNVRKRSVNELKKEVEKWLKKVKILDSMDILEEKKKSLQIEAFWSKVYCAEDEMIEKQQELTQSKAEVEKLENTTLNKANHKQLLQKSKEEIQQQLQEIKQEEGNNQESINTVKNRLYKLKDQVFTKKKTIETINQAITRKNDDRQTIQTELTTAESSQQSKQQVLADRTAKIDGLENKLISITDLTSTTENDISQTRSALSNKIVDVRNIKEELSHIEGKMAQRKAQIHSLKNEADNSITVYGRHMPRLLSAINSAKQQFSELPKGPIGSYIKLKDKKWALPIEELIGFGMLGSFCVNTFNDSQVLSKIFDDVLGDQSKPMIICSKFFHQVHDFSKYCTSVPPDCVALIDVLRITDPVVTNCLIDQMNIETILLASTSELAMKLMSQEHNVPKNCSRTVTIKGDQFYPDPSYRSYAGKQKIAKYLQINASELIKQYEMELKSLADNHGTVSMQERGIKDDIKKLKESIKILEKKVLSLNSDKLKVQDMIEEIKLEELPSEKKFEILREELAELDTYIEGKNNDIMLIEQELSLLTTNVNEVKANIIELKKISRELKDRKGPLIKKLDESNVKLKEIDTDTRYKASRLKQYIEKLEKITLDYEMKKTEYEEMKSYALELGEPPATKRTREEVLAEIEDVEQSLKETSNIMGDAKLIRKTYSKINKKYKQIKKIIDKIQVTLEYLSNSFKNRTQEYHVFIHQIGSRVKEMFFCVLQMRKFKGTLEINHDQKTLEIIVVPQHGSQNTDHKHILSGGERSYSTVAFLMALWQVMEYPFYFLDEFDVFMDKVNRRAVMDMLLDHGLEHKNQQFVFLTPQDISSVKSNEQITIHRMADPERNEIPK